MFTAAAGGKKGNNGGPGAGNPRGATTGPTDAPGYDHPNQFITVKPTEIAPNMEPVIVHKKQLEEAKDKLTKAHAKFGRKASAVGDGTTKYTGVRIVHAQFDVPK